MRVLWCTILLAACGGVDPAAPSGTGAPVAAAAAASPAPQPASPAAAGCAPGVPGAACIAPGIRACERGAADRIGEWRYALIAGPFEPTLDVTADQLAGAWRAGAIAAAPETAAVLAGALGTRGDGPRLATGERPRLETGKWAIVPAHELSPDWSVITVDDQHPLTGAAGPLVVALCAAAKPPREVHNIDPAHLTALVMSGTTAMTGLTAERIDTRGVADTIHYIQPFFRGADFVHISNEVSFVRRCDPSTGQRELKFCSRDSYIELLEALNTKIIELTGSHLIDYGYAPLVRTIDQYEKHGWIWFGGGRTQLDATTPRILEHHGNRLAFVGCNAVAAWIRAITMGPGVGTCHWARMIWQVQDLRRRGYTVIASVQHRELRTHTPPPDLVHDLRSLAEAGASFVLGSQAHVAHPWDVHYGAYVHYGPGNILFAQWPESQRDATVDKLYLHEGKLLTVAHLFTYTERGQPRLQTDAERKRFLRDLAAAAASIAPPDPAAVPVIPPEARERPDSVIINGRSQLLTVTAPEKVAAGAHYPLIVDLAATGSAPADGYFVVRRGEVRATGDQIAAFMRAKYPIDPAQITITAPPPKPKPAKHRGR